MRRLTVRNTFLRGQADVIKHLGITAGKHRTAVEPDCREHGRRLRRLSGRRLHLHGLRFASAAVYDAVVAIQGGYAPYGAVIPAAPGASADAAAIEAAYRTLIYYFPGQAATLDALYLEALALIPDGASKIAGLAVGLAAATNIMSLRANDGLRTPMA